MSDQLIGQRFGNYRLISLIGHGGFANVYLGEHIHISMPRVAIKVIHTMLPEKEQKERLAFHGEAQKLALLRHRHIMQILDFGVEQNIPYIIAEYAPNGTLRQRLTQKPVPPQQIMSYIKQIVEALHYAHKKGFVHRDIKPENILFDVKDRILISDLGLAAVAWDSLRNSLYKNSQSIVGTPYYMAPEQWHAKPVPASDQYALAVIVYEWLCGVRPFEGTTILELMMQHVKQLPPPLRDKVPALSPEVEEVVLKALEKDPKQRFPDVRAFANALAKACSVSLRNTSSQTYDSGGTSFSWYHRSNPAPGSSMSASRNSSFGISRRAMLVCIAGLGTGLVAGTAAYLGLPVILHGRGTSIPPLSTATAPAATASPTAPDLARGTTLHKLPHDGQIYRVAWSPLDGKYLATCTSETDDTVRVWDAAKGTLHASFTGHTGTVTDVAWSPDGTRIASCGGQGDNTLWIWDPLLGDNTDSKVKRSLPDLMNSAQAIAWSPDGKYLAVGGGWRGADYSIYIYDTTGKQVYTPLLGHTNTINSLAWLSYNSADGDQYLASASDDQTARVWKLSTGKSWALKGHQDSVYAVAWSPDGEYLATGAAGSNDQSVKVWKWKEKLLVHTYTGHTKPVYAVTWSPDSAFIASASEDETVHIHAPLGDETLYSYTENRGSVHAAAWSPQEPLIASGDSRVDKDKHYYVRIWQALDI